MSVIFEEKTDLRLKKTLIHSKHTVGQNSHTLKINFSETVKCRQEKRKFEHFRVDWLKWTVWKSSASPVCGGWCSLRKQPFLPQLLAAKDVSPGGNVLGGKELGETAVFAG